MPHYCLRLRAGNYLNHLSLHESLKLNVALTWRIVYIGQASDPNNDQVLEEAEMEDIQSGQMKFVFEVRLALFKIFYLIERELSMFWLYLLCHFLRSTYTLCLHELANSLAIGKLPWCITHSPERCSRSDWHPAHLLLQWTGVLPRGLLCEQLLWGSGAQWESTSHAHHWETHSPHPSWETQSHQVPNLVGGRGSTHESADAEQLEWHAARGHARGRFSVQGQKRYDELSQSSTSCSELLPSVRAASTVAKST